MIRMLKIAGAGALCLSLAACNTPGAHVAGMAAGLDPTGLSSMAVGAATAQSAGVSTQDAFAESFSRLSDIASGRAKRKSRLENMNAQMRAQDAQLAQARVAGAATSAVGAAASAAMTGGLSLVEDVPSIAMQGSGLDPMTISRAQNRAVYERAAADERATRAGTDADLPSQARALLTVLESGQSSVSWRNPRTGKSGTIQISQMSGGSMPGVEECRSATSMRNNDDSAGYLNIMLVCKRAGEWWLVN